MFTDELETGNFRLSKGTYYSVKATIIQGAERNTRLRKMACAFIFCIQNEPVHEISNNVVCATSKTSGQPAHTRSLIRAFASRLSIL